MIKKIRKFSELTKSQKIYIIVFLLFISYMPAKVFLEWKGRDFPQESALNYSTGILKYSRSHGKNSRSFIILRSVERPYKNTVYGCGYSAFTSSASGSCFGLKEIEPYSNKQATVGWYDQSSFLGFKNNKRQLVSLEVDGKQIKTYEETSRIIMKINKSKIYIYFFFIALTTFLFIFCFYPKDVIVNPQ